MPRTMTRRRMPTPQVVSAPTTVVAPLTRMVGHTLLSSVSGGGPVPPITFPTTDLRQRVMIALTPDYSQPYWQWGWTDITEYVRWEPGITVTYGRQDEDDLVSSLNAQMTLTNDGRFSSRNPFGAYAGKLTRSTPIWSQVNPGDAWHTRLMGYVNSWPKRWDTTGRDSTVPIAVGGVMRRLQQDSDDKTPAKRTTTGLSASGCAPIECWPMEDGEDSARFASAIPGGSPLSVVGATLATDDSLPGSEPLPTYDGFSYASAPVRPYTDTGKTALTMFVYPLYPASGPTGASVFSLQTTMGKIAGGLAVGSGELVLAWQDAAGVTTQTQSFIPDFYTDVVNQWHVISLVSERSTNGGTDTLTVYLRDQNGNLVHSLSMSTAVGYHAQGIRTFVSGNVNAIGMEGSYGFLTIFSDLRWTAGVDDVRIAKSMFGHIGETSKQRMARECQAAQVPFYCPDADTIPLGVQPKGTLHAVMRDSEKAGRGTLYEYEFGYGYKPPRSYNNQPVHLALDQAAGQLADSVQAEDSDYGYTNQFTARREDGSEFTFRDPDMRPSDQLFQNADTYNVLTDEPLQDIAGWKVHEGTVDEDRWPMIAIDLANHPELIGQHVAMPFGGRIQVTNPHEEAGIDEIDAIHQGGEEYWNSKLWSSSANTTPASVYDIPRYDDSRARFGARRTVLAAAISDTDTSIAVDSGGETWITTASHPSRFTNLSVEIGGIDYPCTAITGTAPNYTFTITRLPLDRSHDARTPVRVTNTGRYGQ